MINAQNLIGGTWVDGEAGSRDIFSPHDGNSLGKFSIPSSTQIQKAIELAHAAQAEWGRTPIKERSKVLFQARNILLRDLENISKVKSSESGKTIDEGRAGLLKGIEVLEFALSLQNLDTGGKLEVSRGVFCEYRRDPLGVVASITPFNFPAMVPMWTLPIAVALGNAFVWKASDKTPLTSRLVGEAFLEAGLPKGVLTILHGEAESVNAIIDNPLIKAVGFVGSTKVAEAVYLRATQKGKRALALGGAKNHIVLLPDANPAIAGPGISDSFTGCAGQRCMAASVLLAVGNVDEHIKKIIERAKSLDLGKTMGAIISKAQVEFLERAIHKAQADGATILLDGRQANKPNQNGNWIGPTVLDHVKPGTQAATQELFGPILSIIRCRDISEAIKIQNSNSYGNACSVFTSNGALAERVLREAKAGMMGVNVGVPVPREPFSFGGINASKFGHGDITGIHSLDFWSDVKKITTKWEAQSDSNWMS